VNLVVRGALWIFVYVAAVLAPVLFAHVGRTPPARDFIVEVSFALGFVGLAMIGIQFAVTARFQGVAAPYGMDAIIRFHRQVSLVAFALILLHPLLIFANNPDTLSLLNMFDTTWPARLGTASIVVLAVLIGASLWRKALRLNYEWWRVTHGLLAVAAVALALAHVVGVGRYVELPWKQALWITMSVAFIAILFYVRVVKPFVMLRRPYAVQDVIPERGDSYTLVLRPDGHRRIEFLPGQFAWLTVRDSPFTIEEHPFSFSSSALDPDTLAVTIKKLGDFTSTVKDIEPGTRAYLDGPYGAFSTDRHEGAGFVFIAGGIGITPFISILKTLADRDDVRPVVLLYANTDWEGAAFREELERLTERLDLTVVHVLQEAPDDWDGETGFITKELLDEYLPLHRQRLQHFVCGPAPMMDAVEKALHELRIPGERIHTERFELV
jgi:predicted ferric reductase